MENENSTRDTDEPLQQEPANELPQEHVEIENKENVMEQETATQGEGANEAPEVIDGEHVEGENVEGENVEGEHVEGENAEGENVEGEIVEGEEGLLVEGREIIEEGEEHLHEELEGEEIQEEKQEETKVEVEEKVEEEEEGYVEEPPPDPAAPFDFSDSKEALKPKFELRPDQLAEVEQLWEVYQNHTPAYSDIEGYITEKELAYMLKALILMTYTAEQFQELIAYCVRPSHPQGHISFEQFLKMVTIRQRDFPIEDELRSALQVLDVGKAGIIDREFMKEVLAKQGHKMPQKQLDNLIKEVDLSNDGTIGIEDVVGTMCIDLNKEDILMLMASLNPPEEEQQQD